MTRNQWLVLAAALAVVGCDRNEDHARATPTVGQQGAETEGRSGQQGTTAQHGTTQQGSSQHGTTQQGSTQRGASQQGVSQEQAARTHGQAPQHAQIGVRTEQPMGPYLVDEHGHTLYMFTADTQNRSSDCDDRCAQMWPPVLTRDQPRAGERTIHQEKLGTIQRRDGTRQVTYNGWPLYTFSRDRRPGEVAGQDQHGFGGGWYMINPEGQKIEASSQHAER